MWKYLNRGISTPIAITIILILMVVVGGFAWWQYNDIEKVEEFSLEDFTNKENGTVEDKIKNALAGKHEKEVSEIDISIDQEEENHVRGMVTFQPGGSENSGIFLAAKVDNKWEIIHDGQGSYSCSLVEQYNFPSGMVSDCSSEDIGYTDVTVETAKTFIDSKPELIVIDVSPNYDEGHLPGAVNYYVGDGSLDEAIPTLDPNKEYLVYCHVDSASILGAEKLVDAGFSNVYRLEGNYEAWVNAGYPIEY